MNTENSERTVILGFHNRGRLDNEEPTPEPMSSSYEEPEEINVTWVFWLLGSLSVVSLAISIVSLVIACK